MALTGEEGGSRNRGDGKHFTGRVHVSSNAFLTPYTPQLHKRTQSHWNPLKTPIRSPATCRARTPGNRRRRRQERKDDASNTSAKNKSRPSPSSQSKPQKSRETKGDDDLTSLFQEDVKTPLQVSGEQNNKRAGGKSKKKVAAAAAAAAAGSGGLNRNMSFSAISKSVSRSVPESREEALQLLVRGAWIGIFALVGLFFAIHLIIVRDWLPK